jgi:hypothetical protein
MWLPAISYLLCSFIGGLLAVLFGDWVGQQVVRRVKLIRPAPQQALVQTIELQDDTAPSTPNNIQAR